MAPSCTLTLAALVLVLTIGTVCAACPFAESKPTLRDLERASLATPKTSFTASGASAIRSSLNTHLAEGDLAYPNHKTCEEFSLDELAELQHIMTCHHDDQLVALSGGTHREANLRAPRHPTHESLKIHLAAEHADVAADATGAVAAAVRDGRCHTIAMSWVHHLSADARVAMSNLTMPLLPQMGVEEHTASLKAARVSEDLTAAVLGNLTQTVTCQIGHEASIQKRGTWEGFPHWPYEVTYNASGYGPYPFWAGGGGSGGTLSGPGADIQTWWSAVLNAERLDHSSCSLSSLGAADGPCTHLFLNGSWAFLYNKEETFCCMSSAPVQYTPCHLTRPQRNFMDVMTYNGVIDYTSEDGLFKNIKAKKYSMHLTNPSNFWFWYVTDMDDKPLEQGEGPCDMYDQWGTRNYCGGPPKMLFHQYHTSTFKSTTIDPAVFNRPEICKQTPYTYCMVQPTNFCG